MKMISIKYLRLQRVAVVAVVFIGTVLLPLNIQSAPCEFGGFTDGQAAALGTDSVGDGIPDWWRQLNFGGDGTTTNSSSCASCAPDGDGISNYEQYLRGTNPNNPASGHETFYVNCSTGSSNYTGRAAVFRIPNYGPKKTIQAGINATISGDTVHIAAGTYTTNNIDIGNRTITIVPDGTVTIVP